MVEANAQQTEPYRHGVLLMVKAAQNSNGLRHNDYGRYHKYCCRRMLRLRKSLQFTQSQRQNKKHIYVEKPVTADLVASNAKYLQICIFKCESDWAYAMQMKQHASTLSGGKANNVANDTLTRRTNANRLRAHFLKRFRKASQAADKLLQLATGAVDELSLVEIEGYKAQMDATFAMERNDHESAINNFLTAKLIFSEIRSTQDTLEALIYTEKVNQLETFIRSCAASIQVESSDIKLKDAATWTKKIRAAQFMQGSSAKAPKDKDADMNGDLLSEVRLNGRVIPLKSTKLRESFTTLTQLKEDIEAQRNSQSKDPSAIVAFQLKLVQTIDETILLINKEKKEELARSEASGSLYNMLLAHVQLMKLTSAKERNLLQAELLTKQLNMDALLGAGFESKKDSKVSGSEQKPQNIIRFIEKALKAQRALSAFDKEQETATGVVDAVKHTANEFKELSLDALIAYYVTLHYISQRKFLEAIHLSKHTLSQVENCVDFVQRSGNTLGSYAAEVKEEAKYLETQIASDCKKLLIKAHASHLMAEVEAEKSERKRAIQERAKALAKVQGKKNASESKITSLYDHLYDMNGCSKAQNMNQKVVIKGPTLEILESKGNAVSFQPVSSEEALSVFENMKWNKTLKIADPVPQFQSVPATAHLFDLAGGDLDYNSLEAEAAQFQVKSSMFSSIGSFFGRKK